MFYDVFPGIDKKRYNELTNGSNFNKVKPVVDVYETDDSIVVAAEMPNVKKEDLRVQVEDGKLILSGRRSRSSEKGEYLMRESRHAIYERIFELEDDLAPDKITASYKYGVLNVTIGKKEKEKPRVIEISS